MVLRDLRSCLRPTLLGLALATSTLGVSATPARADLGDFFGCFFGGCYGGGGGGGGWGGGGNEEPEEVDPTGVIHTVFIVGDTFFPDEIHANLGDELKFYNLRNYSVKVEATDDSWTSNTLYRNDSWSIILQANTELEFQKASYSYSSMRGEVTLDPLPASVDYGDLIDYEGNIVGKDGVTVATATGLGYTLADVSGTLRGVGNGLAKGLTDAFGVGNN